MKTCMKIRKILKILLLSALAFFGITFIIFMFNLDMKGAGLAYNLLNRWHDKQDQKRNLSF